MDIPYVERSGFLDACERGIRHSQTLLEAGQSIYIELFAEKAGYPGCITVEIHPEDKSAFRADYEAADLTRFPARIRAAATALFQCKCFGRFLIKHQAGTMEIRKA